LTEALLRNFRMLARYNALANRRRYEAGARLPDAERKKRRPAFFGSIHGTLNHLMVGDRIWLARFSGEEVPSTNLDVILYEDYGELGEAREEEDSRIEAFAAGIDERFLEGTIRYVNNERAGPWRTPSICWSRTSSTTRPTTPGRFTTCSPRRKFLLRFWTSTASSGLETGGAEGLEDPLGGCPGVFDR
jgi:uncharacterized damage-inducible protein DinB